MADLLPLLSSALILGLLGGGHCLGMCGGLMGALTLAIPQEQRSRRLRLLLAYNLGRILSYATAGLLLGLAGWALGNSPLATGMRVVAALLLIAMGLYLAVLYFAGLVLALGAGRRWRAFLLYFTLGIAAVALPYLAFLLRGGDPAELIRCLKYILHDPEHVAKAPLRKAVDYVRWLVWVFGPSFFFSVALDGYIVIKRLMKKVIGGAEGRALLLAGALVCCWQIAMGLDYECAALYALALYGFQGFLMTEKPDKAMFFGVFLPGFVFSVTVYLSSNTGFRAVSSGLSASAVASCCLVWDALAKLKAPEPNRLHRATITLAALALACAVAVPLAMRMAPLVRPDTPDGNAARITAGPDAGLTASPAEVAQYQAVYDTIKQYASGEGNLIITRLAPWAYMVSPMRCGSPTTWRLRFNEEWLPEYMWLYPDRKPDLIVSLRPEYDPRGYNWDLPEDNVGPEKLNQALLDYAKANGMERIDTKAAVLFRRPAAG